MPAADGVKQHRRKMLRAVGITNKVSLPIKVSLKPAQRRELGQSLVPCAGELRSRTWNRKETT